MRAGGGAGAVEHQQVWSQQQQRPPHSMGAEGGVEAVEPELIRAGGGAGAVER